MNMHQVNILIKKNVTMSVHMKLTLIEITRLHQMIVILIVQQRTVMKQKMDKFGINYPSCELP